MKTKIKRDSLTKNNIKQCPHVIENLKYEPKQPKRVRVNDYTF